MRHMMTRWVLMAALLVPPGARAASLTAGGSGASVSADAAGAIVTARHDIQMAVNHGSASELLDVRAALLALSEAELASSPAQYTLAYLDWRLVPLWLREHEDKKAEAMQYADEGLAAARAYESREPKNGEGFALEASLLGLKMMSADADVMTLGPASMQAMGKAAKLGATNPRVLLLRGMGQFFTPAQFGGGATPAIATLLQAAAAAKIDVPADSLSPAWGHDDIQTWLGQVYLQNEQFEKAAAAVGQALALNPDNGQARGLRQRMESMKPSESDADAAKEAGK